MAEEGQPLVDSKCRVFHDSADLYAEILLAGQANPDTASVNERMLFRFATRARDDAVGQLIATMQTRATSGSRGI